MNVFYTKTSMWEFDFFKNDIFNKDLYPSMELNLILFDDKTKIHNNNEHNIIITNKSISLKFLENMIKILEPVTIFHLSDEWGKDIQYYDLYAKYNIKLLFHQYNFGNIDYKITNFQIPLAYVSSYLSDKSYTDSKHQISLVSKKYDFSFVGQLKSDRNSMLNKFSENFKNNFVHTGRTNWGQPENQKIKPNKMFEIYKDTLFVPTGRGNIGLDCSRLYECIIAGAIPVLCAPIEEINVTFNFNNKMPHLIVADNWDKVILLTKELYNDKDRIINIIDSNHKWFEEQIISISKHIKNVL